MFAGTKIKIDDEEFVVPPLSLGQLRSGLLAKLQEHDKMLEENKTFETMVLRGEILLQALRRNYPDFPEQKFFDYVDLGNVGSLWLSILGASGFSLGETQAATGPTISGT